MSWTVNVVPTSAPRMIPIAWWRVRSPAWTKPMSITVVAVEDWISAVTPAPVSAALSRFDVRWVRICRRRAPAARWSPSPVSCIP
jgi:hypothetical protein